MIINRKIILMVSTTVFSIALVLLLTCLIVKAQSDIQFTPADKFDIPAYNSKITFVNGGTYGQANLENDTWNFVNLRLINSTRLQNFQVSAKNSNVTIRSYQLFNNSIVGLRLRFFVTAGGVQTFNFGFTPKGGDWGVTFNGVFMGENEGWHVSRNGTITMTEAKGNVTINYYTIPDALGGSGNTSNQTFYQQHSVIITITIVVAIAIILVLSIRLRNKNNSPEKSNGPEKFLPTNLSHNESALDGALNNLRLGKNDAKGRQR
jgi:hypothetical protein